MKELIGVLMITGTLAACNGDSAADNSEQATDTTEIQPTNPASLNDAATHSQAIPRDSVELSSDSTGNVIPGDTTKR